MSRTAVATQQASTLKEWEAYLDKYFAPSSERTVADKFPTLHEIKAERADVLRDLPDNARTLVSTSEFDTASIPIIGIGESFRSKRPKIHEFNYVKMGRNPPSKRESFFNKQESIVLGKRRGLHGDEMSVMSQSSFGNGSTTSSVKRRREASGSPSVDRGSVTLSQRSNSVAPVGPATGPSISHHAASLKIKEVRDQAESLLRNIETADWETTKKYASRIVKYVRGHRRLSQNKFDNTEKYAFDCVRNEFSAHAQKGQVAAALRRIRESLSKRLPKQVSHATIRPIIIVPSTAHSVINIYNAKLLLGSGKWMDPLHARQNRQEVPAEGEIMKVDRARCPFNEFIIKDSASKIKPEEWEYVCCVFVQGPKWQFEGFYGNTKDKVEPRDILDKIAGFNLQYDDEELHENVLKWNVMSLRVSKTMNRRHKDIKTVEDFWRSLLLRMPFIDRFRPFFRDG